MKRAVDADTSQAPGRFILTGSARAARQAATWPGTGRLIRVRMFGLTQGEIEFDNVYNPIDLRARFLQSDVCNLHSCRVMCGADRARINKQATARDAGTTHATADAHLQLLEDLSVVTRVS